VILRVLINRLEVGNGGGDDNGGALTELNVVIGADGTVTVSLANYPFVHLNAIKTGWNSPAGTITSLTLKKDSNTITFADAKVKAICVEHWDTDGDGELSKAEAAAVTSLGDVFTDNKEITSFNELRYFTGLTELPEWGAFNGCTALMLITIPANVTNLAGSAFANCTSLEQIIVDSANTKYESPADDNAVIEKAANKLVVGCETTHIPYGITTIGNAAFWGRWSLQQMVIPETVTTIEGNAFAFCINLTNITMAASVNAIGDGAFSNCDALTSVRCYMETPPAITEDVFTNRAKATLFVPAGTKKKYQAANYWKDFQTVEMSTRLQIDMYHEWDDCTATSKVTNEDGQGEMHLLTWLGSGSLVYGIESVQYQHYADLTGYSELVIEGTPWMELRVLINRLEVGNGGGDDNGGDWTELNIVIGDDGTATVSLEDYPFVHLNAIKTAWHSPAGYITSLTLHESITGDVNGDGKVNVGDIMAVINVMATNAYDDRADVNQDGKVNVGDIMAVINIMAEK